MEQINLWSVYCYALRIRFDDHIVCSFPSVCHNCIMWWKTNMTTCITNWIEGCEILKWNEKKKPKETTTLILNYKSRTLAVARQQRTRDSLHYIIFTWICKYSYCGKMINSSCQVRKVIIKCYANSRMRLTDKAAHNTDVYSNCNVAFWKDCFFPWTQQYTHSGVMYKCLVFGLVSELAF